MNSKSPPDHYAILKIPSNSCPDQIKEAYHALALERHPDKNKGSKESTEATKLLNEAYHVLRDPTRRKAHDITYHAQYKRTPFYETLGSSTIYNASNVSTLFERFMSGRSPRQDTFERAEEGRKPNHREEADGSLSWKAYRAYRYIKRLKAELRSGVFDSEKKRGELETAREEHRRLGQESIEGWRVFWMSAGGSGAREIFRMLEERHRLRQLEAESDGVVKEFAVWMALYWVVQ